MPRGGVDRVRRSRRPRPPASTWLDAMLPRPQTDRDIRRAREPAPPGSSTESLLAIVQDRPPGRRRTGWLSANCVRHWFKSPRRKRTALARKRYLVDGFAECVRRLGNLAGPSLLGLWE